jgi:predicted nucleic acid-binding protein
MLVLFDTSVLVCAVVAQLPRHAAAFASFCHYTGSEHQAACTTHTLAEIYATLTALPLPRRIQPAEALKLIEANFSARLRVVDLAARDYEDALRRVSGLGLASGVIYDALHLIAAERIGCERLYTYNLAHFNRLQSISVQIAPP